MGQDHLLNTSTGCFRWSSVGLPTIDLTHTIVWASLSCALTLVAAQPAEGNDSGQPSSAQSGSQPAADTELVRLEQGCEQGRRGDCFELAAKCRQGAGVPADMARRAALVRRACEMGGIEVCLATEQFGRAALLQLKDAGLASRLDNATTALQTAAALAEYALAACQRRFGAGVALSEDVYLWSRRVLRNRRMLAPGQTATALEAHAEGMRHLEQLALRPIDVEAKLYPTLPPLEAAFYKAEAECLVEQQRQPPVDTTSCSRLALSAAIDNYSIKSAKYLREFDAWSAAGYKWIDKGPELACRWSTRWMRSESAMDAGRRASAARAHVARLEALERETRRAVEQGRAVQMFLPAVASRLCEARHLSTGDTSGWEAAATRVDGDSAELVNAGVGTIEDAYILSLQLLKATTAAHPEQEKDAVSAHAARMSALKNQTLQRVSVGVAPLDAGLAASFYLAEATAWREHPPDTAELE